MINVTYPTLDLEAIGTRIKSLRLSSGYTAHEIATYMGFTGPQAIYKWEWGKTLPTVDNLYALSRLFGVTIEQILVGNGEFLLFMQLWCTVLKMVRAELLRLTHILIADIVDFLLRK